MGWKDVQARVRRFLGGQGEKSSHRPDGGTSCYRPVQRKNRKEEELAREKAAEYAASQGPVAYAHTGFTGMNPPVAGSMPVPQSCVALGEPCTSLHLSPLQSRGNLIPVLVSIMPAGWANVHENS